MKPEQTKPVDVEKELINALAKQIGQDFDWVYIHTYWDWNEGIPRWFRWLCRFRVFFWFAERLKLGQWKCPDPPGMVTNND